MGELLRREGVHEEHLAAWRVAMLEGLSGAPRSKALAPTRQIRSLERELAPKEKALATH